MSSTGLNTDKILQKLGIQELNKMQLEANQAISTQDEVILISPTGTGKTLAFLIPIIAQLDPDIDQTQVLILAPSRELAIQIEQVTREMGSGYKANAVYGGRPIAKDFKELQHPPAILIGTPGRVGDHLRRGTISVFHIKTLILDEFDKSLEVGFEKQMKQIVYELPFIKKKILTSATKKIDIPAFLELKHPKQLDFESQGESQLKVMLVPSPTKDKLDTLVALLKHIGKAQGIIFCNFKDTIQYVSDHLTQTGIAHGQYYGGLEQRDRERALIKFRNGTDNILLSTDLAARGIDVSDIGYIIHYQLPLKEEEFIHRNGRTARMNSDGTAYVIKWDQEALPDFISSIPRESLTDRPLPPRSKWTTLFISGGRKDKISKGDIAGLFFKMGNLSKGELGNIELKQDCAFVAVPISKSQKLIQTLNNTRLKKKKVRVKLLD